ncbi:hypothetical protein F2Q69_00041121 [Brassica cretica]|uniref:Reverse transcriptase domain-containing protein n=1 Tax=Brassica cretica TaxID=69181 RepID=A0A8S9N6V3_BRACR|nr:hypothetical protein F2Q69_00041121 [Brassica cretica]
MYDVSVRQYSQELSVSSVMIPILSRSGYVTFLLPPYFKQLFHEFLLLEITSYEVDVSVRTTGMRPGSYLYSSQCTSYARRTDLFGDSSEIELRFYDVILGMDWLSRHRVVLDCLRAVVDIAGADGSFYCMHATC